jgi:hypothetical protein
MKGRMGLTSHVPQLSIDVSALGVDLVSYTLPSSDLIRSCNLQSIEPAMDFLGDGGSFCNNQASQSPLFVVLISHDVIGYMVLWIKRVLSRSASEQSIINGMAGDSWVSWLVAKKQKASKNGKKCAFS